MLLLFKDRQLSKESKGTESKAGESSLQLSRCRGHLRRYSVLTWLPALAGGEQMATIGGTIRVGAGDLALFHNTHLLTSPGTWYKAHWTSWVPLSTLSKCQKEMKHKIRDSWVQGPCIPKLVFRPAMEDIPGSAAISSPSSHFSIAYCD